MKEKTIKKATPEKEEEKKAEGHYTLEPKVEKAEVYLERALKLQKTKIESQRSELAKMNKVYLREVRNTPISEAFKFLLKVVLNKITNKFKK